MSTDEDLRRSVEATRSVVKASMRSLRTCLQFLADLDEKLDAQPEEAQRNGYRSEAKSHPDHVTAGTAGRR